MKRILYVIKHADYSGAPRHLFTLLSHTPERYSAHLCIGSEDAGLESRVPEGIPIHVLEVLGRQAGPWQAVRLVFRLLDLIRREQIDIVHVHSPLAGTAARIAAAMAHTPCLFTAHGWNFAPGLPLKRRVASWLLEWCVARLGQPVIAVSAFDGRLAERWHIAAPPQLRVIANGIAMREAAARTTSAEPVIVMVARFWSQKRQKDLINAVAGIESPLRVRFVGDGSEEEDCKALARKLGQQGRIEFLGRLEAVDEILQKSDIFVLTSNYEGLPLSILEAMRAGLPVVASDVGGVGEAVLDGETGFLVASGDVAQLRDRLLRLLEDPMLRGRMGLAGRRHFEAAFTEDRMIAETFLVYEEVSAQG